MTVQKPVTHQESWAEGVANTVLAHITNRLREVGHCTVMLTGGRSAAQLYTIMAHHTDFHGLSKVAFYFGDERCVPPDHEESNYGLALRTLFAAGVPAGCTVHRMEGEGPDLEGAADQYASILPDHLDLLLLSMGEDGHIASLFPQSPVLGEINKRVVPVLGPKPPYQRLTITPPVILAARQVFVMALGQQKRAVYESALLNPSDINTIPARLVLNRTWVLAPL